jgi:hypothetical protein
MKTKINNKLIRSFDPCYDPKEIGISEKENLSVIEWVEKYRGLVKNKADIIWLLTRKEFMTDRDIRLFAVWCAREALKLIENPDQRSINACDVSEKFANGQATSEEWAAARDAARAAARDAAGAAARDAAWAAAGAAAWDAAGAAAWDAARDAAGAAARDAAWAAAGAAAWAAAGDAAGAAARDAAWAAAGDAAWDAGAAQIDQLMTYFK